MYDLFINGSPQEAAEGGLRTSVGRLGAASQTCASAYRDRQRDIPYLLQFALNVGPRGSVGEASEKKGRMRRITQWLNSQWKYNLAPTTEMLEAVALMARAQARTRFAQQKVSSGYQEAQDTAGTSKSGEIETPLPATEAAEANTEVRPASATPNSVVKNEQALSRPSSTDLKNNDSGRSLQETSTQTHEPRAPLSPDTIHGSAVPEQSQGIAERTYFILEAAALVHSQDRRGELIAAYSTQDPYLTDLTLLCFANSSMGLLEKLRNKQADRQKLLIHWGQSEEELGQFPGVFRVYLSLKETGRTVSGRHLDDAVRNSRSSFENERTRRGRPRQDALSERVRELRKSGRSWGEIKVQLDKETGVERTAGAYRNLLRSRRKPDGT